MHPWVRVLRNKLLALLVGEKDYHRMRVGPLSLCSQALLLPLPRWRRRAPHKFFPQTVKFGGCSGAGGGGDESHQHG